MKVLEDSTVLLQRKSLCVTILEEAFLAPFFNKPATTSIKYYSDFEGLNCVTLVIEVCIVQFWTV